MTDAPLAVQLIDPDTALQVANTPGARVFRYKFNQPGATVMLIGSGLLLAGVAALWWFTRFEQLYWFIAAVALAIGSVGLLAYVQHWSKFTRHHFVVVDPDALTVGDATRDAWRVVWPLLDVHALGFERLQVSGARGLLQVEVAGQQFPLHLYAPLAHIDDLQGFMVEVLERLRIEQGGDPAMLDDDADPEATPSPGDDLT